MKIRITKKRSVPKAQVGIQVPSFIDWNRFLPAQPNVTVPFAPGFNPGAQPSISIPRLGADFIEADNFGPEGFNQPIVTRTPSMMNTGLGPQRSRFDQEVQQAYDSDPARARKFDMGILKALEKDFRSGRGTTSEEKLSGYRKFLTDKYGKDTLESTGPTGFQKFANNMQEVGNTMKVGIGVGSAVVDFFENQRRERDNKRFLRNQLNTDAQYMPVTGSRGDYVATGSRFGEFRPDQYVVNRGMYSGQFFPAMPMMQSGGVIDDQLTLPSELINIPVYSSSEESSDASRPVADMSVSVDDRAKEAFQYYVKKHELDPHIAAGIVGNLVVESNLIPTVEEKTNTAEGRGIAQWNKNNRWKSFLNWAKSNNRNPNDLFTQLDYVIMEPGESQKVLNALQKANTAAEAAYIFGKVYERPNDRLANWKKRAGIAEKLLQNPQFEEGGVYELTEDEIKAIMAAGGEVEIL